MADREKVIKGLEHCSSGEGCKGCPYNKTESGHACLFDCVRDAIPLLKEQPEIVRCMDCRYGEPTKNGAGDDCIQCNNDDLWLDRNLNFPDWFCADGERRTEEGHND